MAGTTTNYAWTYPTSTDLVKDGATAIQTAIQGADTTLFTALGGDYPGLRLIKTQTIGSAVASVTVTGAFSTTYDNYKIVISGGANSAIANGSLVLGASTTGYYGNLIYTVLSSTTVLGLNDNNAAKFTYAFKMNTNTIGAQIELNAPFLTEETLISSTWAGTDQAGRYSGVHGVSTSYTDFTIATSTGTMTGGTIAVYGYGKS